VLGISWSELDDKNHWMEKVREFIETSRPGDILDVNGRACLIRERPGG
jgi:hypothetical protein